MVETNRDRETETEIDTDRDRERERERREDRGSKNKNNPKWTPNSHFQSLKRKAKWDVTSKPFQLFRHDVNQIGVFECCAVITHVFGGTFRMTTCSFPCWYIRD